MTVAAGVGNTSAYTWLKVPVVPDMAQVMAATTLPAVILGGEVSGDPDAAYEAWRSALSLPTVQGLVVGRALLYRPDDQHRRRGDDTAVSLFRRYARTGGRDGTTKTTHCRAADGSTAAVGGMFGARTAARVRLRGVAVRSVSYTFAVITHGDNGNFWSVVYKGAKDAANDYGCKLSEVYGSQQQGQAQPDDNAENAQIQNAINAKVNGIVVSDHDPSIMNATLAAAIAAGIPVVLLNAGCDNTDIAASKAITCVGQPETLAGQEAGQRLQPRTPRTCCVSSTSPGRTCSTAATASRRASASATRARRAPRRAGPACTELMLSTPNAASNPQQAIGQVTSYLQSHPGINAVMTLNNAIGQALVTAKPANVKIATFDLSSAVETDLQANPPTMDFAVDQQQYLQGYLPISFLYLYDKHEGNSVGGGTTVASGPLLVDKHQHQDRRGRHRRRRRLTAEPPSHSDA